MTATVTDQMHVALPLDVCAELGIQPGMRLDFRAREGRLEAVRVLPGASEPGNDLSHIYTAERDAEEMTVQQACSCQVPEDFPR